MRGVLLDAALEPISTTSKETLNNLFFETGRYELSGKSLTELERLAQFLKINPTTRVEIAGHTDDRGDPVVQLAPPLTMGPAEFDEIERRLRSVLTEAENHL